MLFRSVRANKHYTATAEDEGNRLTVLFEDDEKAVIKILADGDDGYPAGVEIQAYPAKTTQAMWRAATERLHRDAVREERTRVSAAAYAAKIDAAVRAGWPKFELHRQSYRGYTTEPHPAGRRR